MDAVRQDFGSWEADWPSGAPERTTARLAKATPPLSMLDVIGEELLAERLVALTPEQSLKFKSDWIGEAGYAVAGDAFDEAQTLRTAHTERLVAFLAAVSAREERLRRSAVL